MPTIPSSDITGLVLAGGRGSRMGGVDKGLQNHLGLPLAMHALLRLSPQVGHMMINANRNLWSARGRVGSGSSFASWVRSGSSLNTVRLDVFQSSLLSTAEQVMARTKAELGPGARLSDYRSASLLARV